MLLLYERHTSPTGCASRLWPKFEALDVLSRGAGVPAAGSCLHW